MSKSPRWYELKTAEWYLQHFMAGLTMAEPNLDGELEWIGKTKNWTVLTWLEDGVYENEADKGQSLINEYLAKA